MYHKHLISNRIHVFSFVTYLTCAKASLNLDLLFEYGHSSGINHVQSALPMIFL